MTNYTRRLTTGELLDLYVIEGKSYKAIAGLVGANPTTIRRWCREAGIVPRERIDATIAANKRRDWSDYPTKTYSQNRRTLQGKKREIINEYKESRGCQRCGENHPAVLDLHHPDPKTKHPMLRSYISGSGRGRIGGRGWNTLSFADIQAEFPKCEVLCSNCHRKETWEARNGKERTLTDEVH